MSTGQEVLLVVKPEFLEKVGHLTGVRRGLGTPGFPNWFNAKKSDVRFYLKAYNPIRHQFPLVFFHRIIIYDHYDEVTLLCA